MSMEKMSAREQKLYHDLAAKAKRIQRQDAEFFKNIDERRAEVLEHLGVQEGNKLSDIARMYGTDADTLYSILTQPEQIEAFKTAMQQKEDVAASDNENEDVVIEDDDSPSASDRYENDSSYGEY